MLDELNFQKRLWDKQNSTKYIKKFVLKASEPCYNIFTSNVTRLFKRSYKCNLKWISISEFFKDWMKRRVQFETSAVWVHVLSKLCGSFINTKFWNISICKYLTNFHQYVVSNNFDPEITEFVLSKTFTFVYSLLKWLICRFFASISTLTVILRPWLHCDGLGAGKKSFISNLHCSAD